MIYFIKDGLASRGLCKSYKLDPEKNYRFLKQPEDEATENILQRIKGNAIEFKTINNTLEDLEFTRNQISTLYAIVAAILNLGETRFGEDENLSAVIENKETVSNVAELLDVDSRKLLWALTNYCIVRDGKATRKRNSCDEARDARDVLANTLYARLVDYIVNEINTKLAIGKQIL